MTDYNVHSTLFFKYLKRTRNVLLLISLVLIIHFLLLLFFPEHRILLTRVMWTFSGLLMTAASIQAFSKSSHNIKVAWLYIVIYGFLIISSILIRSFTDFFNFTAKGRILSIYIVASANVTIIIAFVLFSYVKETSFKITRELNLLGLIFVTIVMISSMVNYNSGFKDAGLRIIVRETVTGVINLSPFVMGLGIYWISIWKKEVKRRSVYRIILFSSFINFILTSIYMVNNQLPREGFGGWFVSLSVTGMILTIFYAAWYEIYIEEAYKKKIGYNLFYVSRIERIIPIISISSMLVCIYFNIPKLDRYLIIALLLFMVPYNIFFLFFEIYSYRSEDAILSILSISPIGVHITDRNFKKTYFVNKSLYDIFRSSKIPPDLITGNNIPAVLKNKIVRAIAESRTLEKVETVLIRPDGTKFNAECKIIPGKYYAYDVVISWISDITDRKKYEGVILQQKYSAEITSLYKSELLDNLSNRMQSGYVTMKYENNGWPDFVFTGMNKRILELLNIDENLTNKKMRKSFTVVDTELITQFFEVLSTGLSVKRELYIKELNKIFLLLIFRANEDEVALLIDDITQSKRKEKELIERERELRTLLENLPGMAYRCSNDSERTMLFVSQGSLDLSGYRPEELVEGGGVYWNDLIYPEDRERVRHAGESGLLGKQSYYLDYRIITKDRSVKYVWEKGGGVYDDGTLLFFEGFIWDISKQKEAETVLREHVIRESEIEKARALRQMAGGIAHDLNNRLMGIGSYNSLIDIKVKDTDIKKYTTGIQKSIQESTSLIEDLLIFARQSEINIDTFSIHAMLHEIILNLQDEFPGNIKIVSSLYAASDAVNGDYKQINKAVHDIISNAKDAMPDGGVLTISTDNKPIDKISLSDLTGGDTKKMFIVIKITDSGLGIEKKNLNKIFDPFYTTKPVGKGKGLGLSAVYGTIQAHKGAVTVDSTPGKGTSFSIYLPVVED